MTTPRTHPDPVADLAADPVINFNIHSRWSRNTQELSENLEAQRWLKRVFVFLGIAQAEWMAQEVVGGNDVPYSRVGVYQYNAAGIRVRVGKFQGIVSKARGVEGGKSMFPEQILARWDKDKFDEQHKKVGTRPPPVPPPLAVVPVPPVRSQSADPRMSKPFVSDARLEAFLRLCHARRNGEDTINKAMMGQLLNGLPDRRDFDEVGALNRIVHEAESRHWIVAMDDHRTVFGFERDFSVAPVPPVEPATPPPAAPEVSPLSLLPDVPSDLLSLMQNTGDKLRQRQELIARRDDLKARIADNERQQAALAQAKVELERETAQTSEQIAKLDKLHSALEALRAISEQMAA